MKKLLLFGLGHLGSKTRSVGQIKYLVGALGATFLAELT